ncbi:glycerol-3-phosphate 1-O-acyltransferase PlsY [Tepidicaulis sp. LMO-SS28]|uniref:glycerol-3-phosphate 1-O-acyltransferase PlsY n=1 Tax=Tepidicaulis sp. LMO-SS28 TaxID=3447455 RepID=UPI003EE03722
MPDPINWAEALPYFAAALLGGYLLGSIPFGLILTRLAGLGDIRSIGSGNIGATNALRTGNRWVAIGTLIGDAAKGAVAVLIAARFGPDTAVLAGIGAFLGHLFPVWLKFKGGKGISTFIGILLALFWPVGLLFCATWLVVAGLSRYSSLAALVAAVATPVYFAWLDRWQFAEISLLLVLLIFIAHRDNIRRLIKGEESRIGQKS